MLITEIHAYGFRNLKGTLECAPGINILCGENAQGKTNWLEAIYLLGNTKSFRTSSLKEALSLEQSNQSNKQALVSGKVLRGNLSKDIQVQIEEHSKSFYVNGKRETVVRYLGNLDVLVFCGEEMAIVRGEPSERRRFLDRGIVSLSPTFLKVISEYNRILKQKNALLKDAQESEQKFKFIDILETWNEQLLEYGARIHTARVQYTEKLKKVLRSKLFSQKEIDIRYRSCLEQHGLKQEASSETFKAIFKERLKVRMESEIAAGHALVGPHRDELDVLIDDLEVSRFGSAGEQRSALITLDLAQLSVYNGVFEEYPVFLIDDIDAELDNGRIARLLEYVEGKMQVFVSTSKRSIAEQYQSRACCKTISNGSVGLFQQTQIFKDKYREEILEEVKELETLEVSKEIASYTQLLDEEVVDNEEKVSDKKFEAFSLVFAESSSKAVLNAKQENFNEVESFDNGQIADFDIHFPSADLHMEVKKFEQVKGIEEIESPSVSEGDKHKAPF